MEHVNEADLTLDLARLIRNQGFDIIGPNKTGPDLIARKDDVVWYIEVKTERADMAHALGQLIGYHQQFGMPGTEFMLAVPDHARDRVPQALYQLGYKAILMHYQIGFSIIPDQRALFSGSDDLPIPGEPPRTNMVHVRISDRDKTILESLARQSNLSISEVWRRTFEIVKDIYSDDMILGHALRDDVRQTILNDPLHVDKIRMCDALKPLTGLHECMILNMIRVAQDVKQHVVQHDTAIDAINNMAGHLDFKPTKRIVKYRRRM